MLGRSCFCVYEVCARASKKSRKQWLGIVYDRLARAQWAERTQSNEVGFSVAAECTQLKESLLLESEAEYDGQAVRLVPVLRCFMLFWQDCCGGESRLVAKRVD